MDNSKSNEITSNNTETFPFPKLVKTFEFFFPKENGSVDIFTMENLRKYGPRAPILGLLILIGLFVWLSIDCPKDIDKASGTTALYVLTGGVFLIVAIAKYLWWLTLALFSKVVKRSPAVLLAMTAIGPLQALAVACIVHFIGFICGLLASISSSA